MNQLIRTIVASAIAGAGLFSGAVQAQDFPTKPVRIITPFPVGSGPEASVRMVAEKLQKKWGQPVIVENKPGANGFLAIEAFKRGATDGHDLMHLDNVHLSAYPHLFKKLPYDPQKDFDPLLPLFRAHFFFAVGQGSPYKNVAELIADARTKPGKLNYGSWSVGNPVHLGSALFESLTGTQFEHVVYKETSMLYSSVGTGDLAFALGTSASSGALQRAGKIRYIAVIAPKRLAAFPDVPTVAESGGPASLEVVGWTAIAAPKGLPAAVTDKIKRDIESALAEADIQQRYVTFGYEPFTLTREQFAKFIQSESARFEGVIRKAKLALD